MKSDIARAIILAASMRGYQTATVSQLSDSLVNDRYMAMDFAAEEQQPITGKEFKETILSVHYHKPKAPPVTGRYDIHRAATKRQRKARRKQRK